MFIHVIKRLNLPDPVKLERYRQTPDLGPKLLFFSGGSALRKTSMELIQYTHNSIHIITPFDSGGSSATLREAFQMPAVGDIRNRLLALADRSLLGNPEISALFAHRFPKVADANNLLQELNHLISGHHGLISKITDPMRKIIRHHLYLFKKNMPDDFDLRNASIGNLILCGGYLDNRRHLDPVIFIFSKLVQVRGTVRAVLNKYLHLIAETEDGRIIAGQHRITGKEVEPIASKIQKIYLSADVNCPRPVTIPIRPKLKQLIESADLIIYPMGSFYSSILANLLPKGVGTSICQNPCSKIYIPNTDDDPETFHMSLSEQIDKLIAYLKQDDPEAISTGQVLNFILTDKQNGQYHSRLDHSLLKSQGIEIINCPLISSESRPLIDEKLLAPILLSLA